jgi:hypothetical protein
MDGTRFEFAAEDHDGYRLIRTFLPAVVTTQSLSVVIDQYLALWETDLPIVILNDATRLGELDVEVSAVLLAILKRNLLDPRFRGSSWFTGGNARLDAQLRDLHVQAGRDPDSIVETEAEALAYIDRCLDR